MGIFAKKSGGLYATPGYKPPKFTRSTTAATKAWAQGGYSTLTGNKPIKPPKAPRTVTRTPRMGRDTTVSVSEPSAPDWTKPRLDIPYSTRPPGAPPAPGEHPGKEGDLLGNMGTSLGDVTSGNEVNLGNIVPFFMERGLVLGGTLVSGLAGEIIGAVGGPAVRKGAEIVGGGLSDAAMGVIHTAAGAAETVTMAPMNAGRDAGISNRERLTRDLSDPNRTLDEIYAYDQVNLNYVRGLRNQGMTDAQIRQVMFKAVDLPESVKVSVATDPKADVFKKLEEGGYGRQISYDQGVGGQFINAALPMAYIILGIAASGGVAASAKGAAVGLAKAEGVTGAIGRAAQLGFRGAGIATKAGRNLIVAGTGVYGATKVAEGIAQTVGAKEAYDFLNKTLYDRPLSSNPSTAFVTSFLWTGGEAFSVANKLLGNPARAAGRGAGLAAEVGAKGVSALAVKVIGRPLKSGFGDRIETLGDFLVDRVAYMYDPRNKGRALAVLDRYYKRVETADGKVIEGGYDYSRMLAELKTIAADIAISRLTPERRQILASITDSVERTLRVEAELGDEIYRIIREEPQEMARRWQHEAWDWSMRDTGVTFDADAMAYKSGEFYAANIKTHELRNRLDAVVGLAEVVTPDAIGKVRGELDTFYANAGDVVSNEYLTMLQAKMPGFRHAMRDVRDAVREETGGAVILDTTNGTWTRAYMDRALVKAEERYAKAVGLGRHQMSSAVKWLPEKPTVAMKADALGVSVDVVKLLERSAKSTVSQDEMAVLSRFLVASGKTADELAGMGEDAIRTLAKTTHDDAVARLQAKGAQVAQVRKETERLQRELADARAVGDTAAATKALTELTMFEHANQLILDPSTTYVQTLRESAANELASRQAASYFKAVDRIAQVSEDIDELRGLDDALSVYSNAAGGDIGRMFWRGRWTGGMHVPHISAKSLRRIERELGVKLGGEDLAADFNRLRQWLRETPTDIPKIRGIIGAKATDKILRGQPADELIDFIMRAHHDSNLTREQAAEYADEIMANLDRRQAVLDRMDVRSVREAEAVAARQPLVNGVPLEQTTLYRVMAKRMEFSGIPESALPETWKADRETFLDPSVPASWKAHIMRKYGLSPDRDRELIELGVTSAWGADDPYWRLYMHPANVEGLQKLRDGWSDPGTLTQHELDVQVSRLTSVLASDYQMAEAAAQILKQRGVLRHADIELDDGTIIAGKGWIDMSPLTRDDIDEILALEAARAGPVKGSLDVEIQKAIDTGDEEALTRAIIDRATRADDFPPPAAEVSEEVADIIRTAGRQTRQSFLLERTIKDKGGSLHQRVDDAILTDPTNALGSSVLGVILWGSAKVYPHTVEGVLMVLRDIETGAARSKLGIGDAYLAEAQHVAHKLLKKAADDLADGEIQPGLIARPYSMHALSEADQMLMRELMEKGLTIADPDAGLAYGIKKRSVNVYEQTPKTPDPALVRARDDAQTAWEQAADAVKAEQAKLKGLRGKAREPQKQAVADAITARGDAKDALKTAQQKLDAGSVETRLKRPGAVVTEFANVNRLTDVDQAALAGHIPGLVEELLTKRFDDWDTRVSNSTTRHAFNLVFRGAPGKSAYARNPGRYLFGRLANKEIGAFVHDQFIERVVASGVTLEHAEAVWDAWRDAARNSADYAARGSRFLRGRKTREGYEIVQGSMPRFATVHNIPNDTLEGIARKAIQEKASVKGEATPIYGLDAPPPGTTDFAFLFRESASPVMRHLRDGFTINGRQIAAHSSLGEGIEQFYGIAFNKWRTTIYPVFRFAMDVRFAAMEFIEPYALGAGRAAFSEARYTNRGLMDMTADTLAHTGTGSARINEFGSVTWGMSRRFEQAYSVFSKERGPALDAELAAIRKESPEAYQRAVQESLKDRGILSVETPEEFEAALIRMAEDDPALYKAIEDFVDGDTGAWLDELDRWHKKILQSTEPSLGIDMEIAKIIADNPHLAEIASRVGEVNKSYWENVEALFYGKAERSRAERVLNHPLLFWPLSYQLRALGWMADVLFKSVGGLPTKAHGAYMLDQLMAAHNKALETDPAYRDWLDRHHDILFAATMLLPITPDQTGISLSPFTRTALATLGITSYDRKTSSFAIGPIYTVTQLAPNIAGEVWADIGSWKALHDTPVAGKVAYGMTKLISLPHGRTVKWDTSGWDVPPTYVP